MPRITKQEVLTKWGEWDTLVPVHEVGHLVAALCTVETFPVKLDLSATGEGGNCSIYRETDDGTITSLMGGTIAMAVLTTASWPTIWNGAKADAVKAENYVDDHKRLVFQSRDLERWSANARFEESTVDWIKKCLRPPLDIDLPTALKLAWVMQELEGAIYVKVDELLTHRTLFGPDVLLEAVTVREYNILSRLTSGRWDKLDTILKEATCPDHIAWPNLFRAARILRHRCPQA